MRKRTLASVFGLAVGLIAAPAFADDAEERKDKTEELAELLVELEDGASPEEREALEKFMEENFDDDEREQMDGFLDDFEDDDFEDDDEPEVSEFDDELDVEDDDDFFDQEPDERDGDEDELAELDDELGESDDDLDLFDDELDGDDEPQETGDEIDDDEFDEVADLDDSDELDDSEGDSEVEEPGFVVPAGGIVMKGFAAGIGKFEDQVLDRAVATRSTTGPDGVTVTITDNGSDTPKAVVSISGLSIVNQGDTATPIGDLSINGKASGPRTFEGATAAVAGDGTKTASSAHGHASDDFDHLVWGQWSFARATGTTADRQDAVHSHLLVGHVTPDTADLTGLGTATYNGVIEGGFAPGGGAESDAVSGNLSLTADFATKTFDGTYGLDSTDFGTVVSNGTIESGSWSNPDGLSASLAGNSTMGAVSGDLQGAFFGPNAEEVGGNWELQIVGAPNSGEVGGVAAGAFAAKR